MLTHRQMSFCSYWDGANVLRFTPADEVQAMYPVRFTDRMKAWIEHKLDSRVDWYPLKQGRRSCPHGHMRITWKVRIRPNRLYQYDNSLDSGMAKDSLQTSHGLAPKSIEAVVSIYQPCLSRQIIQCNSFEVLNDHIPPRALLCSPHIIRILQFDDLALSTTRGPRNSKLAQYNLKWRQTLVQRFGTSPEPTLQSCIGV
jgi:hypothetical protein